MPQLNNELFDASKILGELKKPARSPTITILEIVQRKLKANLFGDPKISNDDVKLKIKDGRFKDFPSLEHVLTEIFNDKDQVVIPEGLKDWSPSTTFHELNHKYGYFEQGQDLTELFNPLAVSGRKMTSIIENQAYDDEMAYKLMALFYDPKKSTDENFANIAKKFANLVTKKQDKSIQTPYHDAFVVALNPFPAFSHVKDLRSWKTFIEKEGFKSLSIFAECATTREAFTNIKDANQFLLTKQYPRAHEHPDLAALCKKLLIKNDGFEAGLAQVQTGWPKKETDSLPLVEIADKSGMYFWVKLPPQDMRAMYLGNLIPGCCQYIDGASKQCVIDGMTLSDNGFYVLLKANSKDRAKQPRLIGNEINDKDFEIVAQSYAWKTENGNLCLDSIEWHRDRVSTEVIQNLMSKFSKNIFGKDPSIKHLTVGQGGQTPRKIYPSATFPESMKQGYMYRDARNQYQISSNMSHIDELTEQLEPYSEEFKQAFLYLAPYFNKPNVVLEKLMSVDKSIETELPRFLRARRVNLPARLSSKYFKEISYADYTRMDDAEKAKISTICKLFNTRTADDFLNWLPTIPDKDLPLIKIYVKDPSENKIQFIERLQREERLSAITKSQLMGDIGYRCRLRSKTCIDIFGLLDKSDCRLAIENYGAKWFFRDIVNEPEALTMALNFYTKVEQIELIKKIFSGTTNVECFEIMLNIAGEALSQAAKEYKDTDTTKDTFLHKLARYPDLLKMILELYPTAEEKHEAIHLKNGYQKSPLWKAGENRQSLELMLNLYSKEDRLNIAQQTFGDLYTSISNVRSAESLDFIFSLYNKKEIQDLILQPNSLGKTVLELASNQAEKFKLILELIPEEKRIDALKVKLAGGNSLLHHNAANSEILQIIWDALPEGDRLEMLRQKNDNKERVLDLAKGAGLPTVIDFYPKDMQLPAIKEKAANGMNSLQRQAEWGKGNEIAEVLKRYPKKEWLSALTERYNECSHSALLRLSGDFRTFTALIVFLPEDMISEVLLQQIGRRGEFIGTQEDITELVLNKIHQLLFKETLLPKDKVFEVLYTKDANGSSLFNTFERTGLNIPTDFLPKDDHSKPTPQR